jgi:N-acyl homoserine lactone hydrolase
MSAWRVEPLLEGTGYSSSCTLLSNGTHRVVVDTALSLLEHDLRAALARHGLEPADIDIVINTHLHLDHCLNNAIFPRAAIFLSRGEWQWASAFYASVLRSKTPELIAPEFYPELPSYGFPPRTIRNVARMARLFWTVERVGAEDRFRWLEETNLPAGLEVMATPGHTPHHISIRVPSLTTIVAGDAVLAEDLHARVKTMIPYHKVQFEQMRERLLATGWTIYPGHGRAFQPVSAVVPS